MIFFDKLFRKFLKSQEYHRGFYDPHPAGLSIGTQVDGLPGALHTEAPRESQGAFRPAPIEARAKKRIVNI